MELIAAVVIGVTLDLVLGDPVRMPHVVRLVGWASVKLENPLCRLVGRTVFAGFLLWGICVFTLVIVYFVLAGLLYQFHPWAKVVMEGLVIFQCIAFRDLVKHVKAVKTGLNKSIQEGRRRVSWIVGRDTKQMEREDVCRAAIESGSENLNDAVIGPLFWIALFGPAGALLYRVTNTLDAMVGHRTERFEKFGKVSARMDDVLNFIPARLCAAFILPFKKLKGFFELVYDAGKHPSINSGWPEAAMSRALGVVIGGKMYVDGELVQTQEMNEGARQPTKSDIDRQVQVMKVAYAKALGCLLVSLLLLRR